MIGALTTNTTAALLGRLPTLARLLLIVSGALHTSVSVAYQLMNPDGIAYLDIADAYMRRDWRNAINPVWSPLYSLILAPVIGWIPHASVWEFPLVQLSNFVIYLSALAAFEFFWRQLTRYAGSGATLETPPASINFPWWAWQLLGYALFGWSSLVLITVSSVTPDLLMASLVYVAAGLLVRLRLGHRSPRTFVTLGLVLGFAYLAKSVMFPLALVALVITVSGLYTIPGIVSRGAMALGTLVLVSGPFIMMISHAKGRLTIGEAGRLTYARLVNDVPYPHWLGNSANVLTHPSRKILSTPAIYEFGWPIASTYPISYDPSHWYEGVIPRVSPVAQLAAIRSNLGVYWDLCVGGQDILTLTVCILYWMAGSRPVSVINILRNGTLALLSLAAFGLYALVLVEPRYVAVFFVLFWSDVLANLRLPITVGLPRVAAWSGCVILACLLLPVWNANVAAVRKIALFMKASPELKSSLRQSWPHEVADELDRLGIAPGSKVAVIGFAFSSYWARLARVQIVAEMFGWEAGAFWEDASTRAEAIRAFADSGAAAIIAEDVFTNANLSDWHQVGHSHHYIYLLED